MGKDILEIIIADKRNEVDAKKAIISVAQLLETIDKTTYPRCSMSHFLANSETGIIAEFKRKSPSKGWINQNAETPLIVPQYQQAGASAISILTDEKYFGGTLSDLTKVRELVTIPILRKEFIVSEYQLIEAKAAGADAILLIAAALNKKDCASFAAIAQDLGLEVLLELHCENELEHISNNIDMVGINNRNLGTFHTDIENSYRMVEFLPSELVKVSESGISNSKTISELRAVGYQGFLIGEQFMKSEDPAAALAEFISNI